MTDRLTVGVAARLSRYLQVLTQAKKMGKERISSQEMSDYTNINATQIRRDLSAFGKFGKRGVGYNIDSLLGEIRKILRTQGQHNIALIGAGRLGQAIASSSIFAEHGINIAAVFDRDPGVVGNRAGHVEVQPYADLKGAVQRQEHHRRRSRGSGVVGPGRRQRPGRRGREDHLQLQRGAAGRPGRRCGAHVEPGRRATPRAVLPPGLAVVAPTVLIDGDRGIAVVVGPVLVVVGRAVLVARSCPGRSGPRTRRRVPARSGATHSSAANRNRFTVTSRRLPWRRTLRRSLIPCESCSGTGTCSREPGRTSTRGRSRASGRAPVTRSSSSARTRRRSGSTSAGRRSCGRRSARGCPCS